MNVFDLFARLSLDSSEYDKGLDAAKSAGSKLGSGIASAAKIGLSAVTAATGAVVGFGAASVKTGATFDSSMSQVAATMGKTTDEIQNLRDFAQEMGRTTAFSATEAADALNYMALAGYEDTQAITMLPNVLNLAAAGAMDLATASDMVTDAQSALGLKMENMEGFVDQLAQTASKSNTSVQQLGDAILTVGGTAKVLSGGTTELNTALGLLADNGIKGAEGGTKLRNVILSLSAPTDKAAQELEALGVATVDAEGNMLPLEDIMGQLGDSLDGLGTADRAAVINTIFNKQDIGAVNALLDTSTDRWNELSAAIDDADGAASKMAETQLDNLAGDVTLFKSALEGAQIAVSDVLSPALREFVQFGTDGLSRLTEAFQEGGLSGAMDVFGDILSEGLSMIISKLPDMVNAGMELLSAFGQGLMDNIDVIVFAAYDIIGELLNGLLSATQSEGNNTIVEIIDWILGAFEENYMDFIEVGFQILTNILDGFANGESDISYYAQRIIEYLGNTIIQYAPQIISAATQIITSLVDGISSMLPTLIPLAVEVLMAIITALIDNAPLLLEAAVTLINGLVEGIISALPILIEALPALIESVVNALISALPVLIQGLITLVMGIVNALPEIITALIEALPQIIMLIQQAVIQCLPILIQGAVQLILALVEALPEIIQALIDAIPMIIESVANMMITNAPLLLNALVQIGASLIELVIGLGQNLLTTVSTNVSTLITTIVNWVSQLPAKVAYWVGEMIAKFINLLVTLPQKAQQVWSNFLANVKSFGTKLINEAPKMASEFGQKLINKLKELPSKMMEVGHDIVEGLKEGISKAWTALTDWVKDIAGNLIQGFKDTLKIGSPSKVFRDEIGRWIPAGIAEGIERNADVLYDVINSMTSNMMPDSLAIDTGFMNKNRSLSGNAVISNPVQPINVYVTLEGDADRIFRVVKAKAVSNYELTGNPAIVMG